MQNITTPEPQQFKPVPLPNGYTYKGNLSSRTSNNQHLISHQQTHGSIPIPVPLESYNKGSSNQMTLLQPNTKVGSKEVFQASNPMLDQNILIGEQPHISLDISQLTTIIHEHKQFLEGNNLFADKILDLCTKFISRFFEFRHKSHKRTKCVIIENKSQKC